MGKLICGVMRNGEEVLSVLTTVPGVTPFLVKTTPGVGKPYWYWETIPPGKVVAADFTGSPIATAVTADNAAQIAAITALPQDVLTYEEPVTPA